MMVVFYSFVALMVIFISVFLASHEIKNSPRSRLVQRYKFLKEKQEYLSECGTHQEIRKVSSEIHETIEMIRRIDSSNRHLL